MTQKRPQTEEERAYFLRFLQPDRWPLLVRFPVSAALHDELMAQVLGCRAESVRHLVSGLKRKVTERAAELMREPAYRADIDNLPFADGDVVVAIGDSITADRLGWFDLFASSLDVAGREDVKTHNLGVSGDTTADIIDRWDLIAATRATHVLAMLGTNDARGHGTDERYRMVTPRETVRNLTTLDALVTGELGAKLTWITPTPANGAMSGAFMADQPVGWRAEDIDGLAEIIRGLSVDNIDVHAALVDEVRAGRLVEQDGLHLNLDGQSAVARIVAAQLRQAVGTRSRRTVTAAEHSADASVASDKEPTARTTQ